MSDTEFNLKREGLPLVKPIHSPDTEPRQHLQENLPAAERMIFERLLAEEKPKGQRQRDLVPGDNSSGSSVAATDNV
jgi:hypothetical protein